MPSPFPGMDPYLERRDLWPDVHHNLITSIQHILAPRLRPRYFVGIEKRVYVLTEDDPAEQGRLIVPDVVVHGSPGSRAPRAASVRNRGAQLLMVQPEFEVREWRLVIHELPSQRVVTVIELLSPTNKVKGSHGREEYLTKRNEVLGSDANLVEIDLLRAGERFPSVDALPPGDYLAHVSRAKKRPMGEVFAWTVRDKIPLLPVPLREGGREPRLDVGAALREIYDQVGYDLQVDDRRPPDPPLSAADATWARALLSRSRGKARRRRGRG